VKLHCWAGLLTRARPARPGSARAKRSTRPWQPGPQRQPQQGRGVARPTFSRRRRDLRREGRHLRVPCVKPRL